jgi:hypothetical protein
MDKRIRGFLKTSVTKPPPSLQHITDHIWEVADALIYGSEMTIPYILEGAFRTPWRTTGFDSFWILIESACCSSI